MESPVTTDEVPDNSKFSQSTTILLGVIFIYLICTLSWFIQSRYCSTACRGPTFLSQLRQQCALWKGSQFKNSHRNIHHLPNHYNLDEREYRSWSVSEVASWSRSRLAATQSNCTSSYSLNNTLIAQEDDIILQQSIDALLKQRIDGASLDYMTLEFLTRWVPFGIANHLMSHYDALISSHSIHGNDQENMTATRNDDLPSWYSNNQLHQKRNNHQDDVEAQDPQNSEHVQPREYVQQLMKDRFGLSLPTLRTDEKLPADNKVASALEMSNRATSNIRQSQSMQQDSVNNSNNLGDILKAMPQQVRAIAERRPELVSELLASRQQQQGIAHKQQPLIPIHEEDRADEVEEEEADFDCESASLLRRRIK